jgi:hypothetical protein
VNALVAQVRAARRAAARNDRQDGADRREPIDRDDGHARPDGTARPDERDRPEPNARAEQDARPELSAWPELNARPAGMDRPEPNARRDDTVRRAPNDRREGDDGTDPHDAIDPAAPSGPAAPTIAARLDEVRAVSPRLHARLAALDPAQQAAVLAEDRAAVVHAHVGSGKTTVLIHKAMYLHLVRGVPLDAIAVVTFTNRAADELRARLDELAGRATTPDERWLVGTFHGVACTLLRRALPIEHLGYRRDFEVLDDDAVDALIAEVRPRVTPRPRARRRLRERLRAIPIEPELAPLAVALRQARHARNALDFDDLIAHATALLADHGPRPRWLLVDELQDCAPRDLAFVQALRGPATCFFGVGDPLQSIYGWRGGAPGLFARAATEPGCARYQLPISYRSTRTILDGARAILGAQPVAAGALHAARDPGAPIAVHRHHDPIAEAAYLAARLAAHHAAGVPYRALAVLCRLRAQVVSIAAALGARAIPCVTADDDGADAVRVLTLHAAKGLEFDHVVIAGANLGILPLVLPDQPTDHAEERRLLYVGLTRARDSVEVSYQVSPHQHGAVGAASPLLAALPSGVEPPAPVPAGPATRAPVITPWAIGQVVRHPRYGQGVITAVTADTIAATFGKLGARSFPIRLCPLIAAGAP